ncbi:MAG: serine--tRNA ligase, partial [Candidatus Andersenbacteria bacterium]
MLDITFVRKNREAVETAARNKNVEVDLTALLILDEHRRGLQQKIDSIEQQRNTLAQSTKGTKPAADSIEQGKQLRIELDQLEQEFAEIDKQFQTAFSTIPNLPSTDTPVGPDAQANKVLRQVGDVPQFPFPAVDHVTLGAALNLIDSERAAKVSGSRFAYVKGELAWLEFALIQFALSVVTNEAKLNTIIANSSLNVPATPFIPVIPPVLIKPEALERMARLEPKEDRYYIPSDDLYLVGSAEHTLGAMHMDETFNAEELPLRYIGYSTSFR